MEDPLFVRRQRDVVCLRKNPGPCDAFRGIHVAIMRVGPRGRGGALQHMYPRVLNAGNLTSSLADANLHMHPCPRGVCQLAALPASKSLLH